MSLYKTSSSGRALIEKWEGLRLRAYPDPATGGDPWTIGFGDTGPDVVPGLVITADEADQRLSNRLAHEFEPAVNKLVGSAATTQGQFDAMISLTYNIGPGDWKRGLQHRHDKGGFEDSSVLREHLAGNYDAAAADFLLWDKANGFVLGSLLRRRKEEARIYLSTATPPVPVPNVVIDYLEVQRLLNAWGIEPALDEDGRPGPKTRAAVRVFQSESGLAVTGLIDEALLIALRAAA